MSDPRRARRKQELYRTFIDSPEFRKLARHLEHGLPFFGTPKDMSELSYFAGLLYYGANYNDFNVCALFFHLIKCSNTSRSVDQNFPDEIKVVLNSMRIIMRVMPFEEDIFQRAAAYLERKGHSDAKTVLQPYIGEAKKMEEDYKVAINSRDTINLDLFTQVDSVLREELKAVEGIQLNIRQTVERVQQEIDECKLHELKIIEQLAETKEEVNKPLIATLEAGFSKIESIAYAIANQAKEEIEGLVAKADETITRKKSTIAIFTKESECKEALRTYAEGLQTLHAGQGYHANDYKIQESPSYKAFDALVRESDNTFRRLSEEKKAFEEKHRGVLGVLKADIESQQHKISEYGDELEFICMVQHGIAERKMLIGNRVRTQLDTPEKISKAKELLQELSQYISTLAVPQGWVEAGRFLTVLREQSSPAIKAIETEIVRSEQEITKRVVELNQRREKLEKERAEIAHRAQDLGEQRNIIIASRDRLQSILDRLSNILNHRDNNSQRITEATTLMQELIKILTSDMPVVRENHADTVIQTLQESLDMPVKALKRNVSGKYKDLLDALRIKAEEFIKLSKKLPDFDNVILMDINELTSAKEGLEKLLDQMRAPSAPTLEVKTDAEEKKVSVLVPPHSELAPSSASFMGGQSSPFIEIPLSYSSSRIVSASSTSFTSNNSPRVTSGFIGGSSSQPSAPAFSSSRDDSSSSIISAPETNPEEEVEGLATIPKGFTVSQ